MGTTAHKDHSHDGHGHHRHNLDREASPTQTRGLQRAYRVELERRFRKLRGVIRETVDANDALRLREERTNAETPRAHTADDIGSVGSFPVRQRAAKQAAFQTQLQTWLDQGILEPADGISVVDGEHWTGTYVRAPYREGLRYADQRLSEAGIQMAVGSTGQTASIEAAFNRPIHTDQLEQIYTRNYENLQDITRATDRTLSRVLTRGLAEGKGPRMIANELTSEVRTIQRTRARALARSEVLFSHNNATKTRYREMGVAQMEVATHAPCEICQGIAANGPYPVDESNPIVPAHPNCVCSLVPVTG